MKVVKTNKLLRNFKTTIENAKGEPIMVLRPDQTGNVVLLPQQMYEDLLERSIEKASS